MRNSRGIKGGRNNDGGGGSPWSNDDSKFILFPITKLF